MSGKPPFSISAIRAFGEIAAVLTVMIIALYWIAFTVSIFASPYGVLAGVGAALAFVALRGEDLSGFGFRLPPSAFVFAATAIGMTATAFFIFLVLDPILAAWLGPVDLSVFAPLEGNMDLYILMLTVSWIPAGFGEEALYRGFIQTRIAQAFNGSKLGWAVAILLQAAVFGLIHAYQGPTGMIQIFLYALVAGVFYLLAGRSIWPLVIAHGLIDTVGVTDFYLGGALFGADPF